MGLSITGNLEARRKAGKTSLRSLLALTCVSLAALTVSTSASAAKVLFEITGDDVISFTVDKSPTPDFFTTNFFRLEQVPITVNGLDGSNQSNFSAERFEFFFSSSLYEFGSFANFWTGTYESPTFITGNYMLYGENYTNPGDSEIPFGDPRSGIYSLSISDVSGAIPEPATWAMLIAGFGMVGVAARRKRQTAVTA